MSTLNVKLPDGMEEDIEEYLQNNPHYLNKSELVRDALRHVLSTETGTAGQPSSDDPLFSAPTVTVADPVAPDEIDDVVYDDQAE